jgi:uncharacterized protein
MLGVYRLFEHCWRVKKHGDTEKATKLREVLGNSVKLHFQMKELGNGAASDVSHLGTASHPATADRLRKIADAICGHRVSGGTIRPKWTEFWKDLTNALEEASKHISGTPLPQETPESLGEYFEIFVGLKPPPTPELRPESVFMWTSGITNPAAFFGRRAELQSIGGYLGNRQNCQIVGERRIGKTSLMLEAGRRLPQWVVNGCFSWVTMQASTCHTLKGWLETVTVGWGWQDGDVPATMPDFVRRVEMQLKEGKRLVLAMDECESFLNLQGEFPLQFFLDLRACAQMGLSILTCSRTDWRALSTQASQTSPFYNTFPIVDLGPLSDKEARDYVDLDRPGLPKFSDDEKAAILKWAQGHPLKLQLACNEILKARGTGTTPSAAVLTAERQASQMLPAAAANLKKR